MRISLWPLSWPIVSCNFDMAILQIEQAKLLSTAEKFGLLTVLERLLVTDPGRVTALSIPFFLASVGKMAACRMLC